MLRKQELMQLVADTRLTPGALRVVLDVALRGTGDHEIATSHFAALLNHPGEKKVRSEVSIGVDFGYVTRRRGGRGRHDFYTFNPAEIAGLSAPDSELNPAETAGLNDLEEPLNPAVGAGLNDNPAKIAGLKPPHAGPPHSRAAVGRRDVDDVEDDDEERAELRSVEKRRALDALRQHDELFTGCRGALTDYVRSRVPLAQQYSYIQTVAGWLNGTEPALWKRNDGSELEPEFRVGLLASALNDLGASKESKMSRDPGDIGNLRTKLRVLLDSSKSTPRSKPRPPATERPQSSAPRSGSLARIDGQEADQTRRIEAWTSEHPEAAKALALQAKQETEGHYAGTPVGKTGMGRLTEARFRSLVLEQAAANGREVAVVDPPERKVASQ